MSRLLFGLLLCRQFIEALSFSWRSATLYNVSLPHCTNNNAVSPRYNWPCGGRRCLLLLIVRYNWTRGLMCTALLSLNIHCTINSKGHKKHNSFGWHNGNTVELLFYSTKDHKEFDPDHWRSLRQRGFPPALQRCPDLWFGWILWLVRVTGGTAASRHRGPRFNLGLRSPLWPHWVSSWCSGTLPLSYTL